MHRDLKAGNVFLAVDARDRQEVKLLDFGIAKLLDPSPEGGAFGHASGPERPSVVDVAAATALVGEAGGGARVAAVDREATTERGFSAAVGARATAVPVDREAATARVIVAEAPAPPPGGVDRDAPTPRAHIAPDAATLVARPDAPWHAARFDATATRPGSVLGTPAYMAPEVWRGEPATFRADVYSLGALLHTLCAGVPPHAAPSLIELRHEVIDRDARPLEDRAPEVDLAFAAIVDRCLCRDPAARYADGNEVRAALADLGPEGRAFALPEGNPYRGLAAFDAEHAAL